MLDKHPSRERKREGDRPLNQGGVEGTRPVGGRTAGDGNQKKKRIQGRRNKIRGEKKGCRYQARGVESRKLGREARCVMEYLKRIGVKRKLNERKKGLGAHKGVGKILSSRV